MNDKNLKNGINEIKNIKMTNAEKEHIFENIFNLKSKVAQPTESPWSIFAFVSVTKRNQLVYYIIIPLVLLLSGSGVVFASQDSLPDSMLYPIKVSVVEPIGGALKFSLNKKAKYESSLATKRLVEAETLVNQGKLDKVKEDKINNLLTKHTNALNVAINEAIPDDANDEMDIVATDFRAQMNAHAKVLDVLSDKKERKDEKNKDIETELEAGVELEADISNTKISNTARLSADTIKDSSSNKNDKKIKNFKEKEDKVRFIVEDVDKNINSTLVNDDTVKDSVSEDSFKKLDQAKAYLYDAEKKDEEGKHEEAYDSLLDSLVSANEANILLEEGQKIEKNKEITDFLEIED